MIDTRIDDSGSQGDADEDKASDETNDRGLLEDDAGM